MNNYGLLTTNNHFQYIENIVGECAISEVNMTLNFVGFLKDASKITLDILILDTTSIEHSEEKAFINALTDYRIIQENTRIIIMDLKRNIGSTLLNEVFSLGILDIISIEEEELIPFNIRKAIEEKKSYAHGVRYKIEQSINHSPRVDKIKNIEEKIIVRDKLVGRVVVSLTGTHKRVGVTHLSIAMANYLQRKGYSVAFLELNESGHVECFLNQYEGLNKKEHYYTYKGVDYYIAHNNFDINIPFGRGYDFFVLDMGYYNPSNIYIPEFERAHIRGVVSTAREWEINHLEKFLSKNNSSNYDYLINFANQELVNYLDSNINVETELYKLIHVPHDSDLLEGKMFDDCFENLLKKYLPSLENTKKKDGFVSKFLNKRK